MEMLRKKQRNKQRIKETNEETNKESNRERKKQTEKQTNKQTNKHTYIKTNKQTNKQASTLRNKQTYIQTMKETNKQSHTQIARLYPHHHSREIQNKPKQLRLTLNGKPVTSPVPRTWRRPFDVPRRRQARASPTLPCPNWVRAAREERVRQHSPPSTHAPTPCCSQFLSARGRLL